MTTPIETSVLDAIHELIAAGTSFDVDQLERLYHDSLTVLMVAPDGQVSESSKADFKSLFQAKRDAGDPPLNTAARFLHSQANDDTAHVIVERSVALGPVEQDITLSIDLIFEDGRWQVTREVIFVKAD